MNEQQRSAIIARHLAERRATLRSWIEGPKSARLPEFIRKASISAGIQIDALTTERRWFTETVFFEVSGEKRRVDAFRHVLDEALRQFNAAGDS